MNNKELINKKSQDPIFYNMFIKEWTKITKELRDIQKLNEINKKYGRTNNDILRPTSSGLVYLR